MSFFPCLFFPCSFLLKPRRFPVGVFIFVFLSAMFFLASFLLASFLPEITFQAVFASEKELPAEGGGEKKRGEGAERNVDEEPEFLRQLFQVSDEQWSTLIATPTPETASMEPLLKIMSRLRQPHVENVLRDRCSLIATRQHPVFAEDLIRKIDALDPGAFVELSDAVRVKSITALAVSPGRSVAEEFGNRIFRCELSVGERKNVVCLTPRIPRSWGTPESQDFDVAALADTGFRGVLLFPGATPVFVASKLQSFPNTLLGRFGMDASSLESITPESQQRRQTSGNAVQLSREDLNRMKFSARDFEPFYEMLETASRIPPEEIDREIDRKLQELEKTPGFRKGSRFDSFPVIDLFNRPESRRGDLVRLVGYARSIERISVDDPEVVRRFGIDHYFQISLFTDDSQNNPLVVCIRVLPEGIPLGSDKDFVVPLSFSGFFYKTWAYTSPEGAANPEGGEQEKNRNEKSTRLTPLLVGAKVDWFESPGRVPPDREIANPYQVWGVVFLLFVLFLILSYRFSRRVEPIRFRVGPDREWEREREREWEREREREIDEKNERKENSTTTSSARSGENADTPFPEMVPYRKT